MADAKRRIQDLSASQLRALARRVRAKRTAAEGEAEARPGERISASLPPLVPQPRDRPAPVSHQQLRLWILARLEPDNPLYNNAVTLAVEGALEMPALRRALTEITRRQTALRTRFEVDGDQPVQVVEAPRQRSLPTVDLQRLDGSDRLSESRRLAATEARQPCDLARGPLMRCRLLRLGALEHWLLITVHHIVADGWSMDILGTELITLYRAWVSRRPSQLPELTIHYTDFSHWQRQCLEGGVLEAQLAYWRGQLADCAPLLELPTDRPRPAVQSHRGAVLRSRLPGDVWQRLQEGSRESRVTPFVTLLSAFNALLARLTGRSRILVGAPIANRNDRVLEGLVGFFANVLVLRGDIDRNDRFTSLQSRLRNGVAAAFKHQDLPFERLVEELQPERSLSASPIFQVAFSMLDVTRRSRRLLRDDALTWRLLEPPSVQARFDLTLYAAAIDEGGGALELSWEYATDLFDATTVRRFGRAMDAVLESVAADPRCRLADLEVWSRGERHQMLHEWHATPSHTSDPSLPNTTVVDLLAARVEQTPDAVAVADEDRFGAQTQLSYRALDTRAEQLARRLLALGVKPETRVGLCAQRSVDLLVALLGIVKSGGAYVPLDPHYPAARLDFMLEDSGATVLVTEEAQRHLFEDTSGVELVYLDTDRLEQPVEAAPGGEALLPAAVRPSHLAYVIYTSGSTGKPKGVQISHRSLVSFLGAVARRPGLGRRDVLTAVTSLSFDIAGLELFLPLLQGARLELASGEAAADGQRLLRRLEQTRTNVLQATPATWRMMIAAGWHADRPGRWRGGAQRGGAWRGGAWCGGEALPADLALELLVRSTAVWNLYGPTEATIWSTVERVVGSEPIVIGRPLDNTRTHVLDRELRGVPRGVVGELYLGGQGLARGYRDRPGLTAAAFVPDLLATRPGERLYRTGDLARRRADGALECLGRRDHQVKIHGFRIELGEIETRLSQAPGIRQAVAVVDEAASGARLVAYVIARSQPMPKAETLLDFLRQKLPAHMLPALIVELEAWPLTPNGKVDRLALRRRAATETGVGDAGTRVSPRSPIEEVLAAIWQDVLGCAPDRLGVHDNFFALGGHSLLAVQVLWRLPEALGVELPLRTLFEAPTVAGLAERVEVARRGSAATAAPDARVPLAPVPRPSEGLPLSFAQQRLWVLERLGPEGRAYAIPAAVRLSGAIDAAALRQGLGEILCRHEALRTVFREVSGRPLQVVTEVDPASFSTVDLSRLEPAAREPEARRRVAEEARQPFDLAHGPLCRIRWLRLGADDVILLVTMHHIISDGWSIGIFVRELTALYEAFRRGGPYPLAALPVQYADFAIWQRRWLAGDGENSVLDHQLAYWRQRLASVPQILELPTDRPRPPLQEFVGARQPVVLEGELADGLRALCHSRGLTPFMVLLAAFVGLLYRLTGRRDLLVGTPIAGRPRPELEGLIGFFANTLVLRGEVAPGATFEDLLEQVRQTALDAFAHQDVPFEQLVQELEIPRDLSTSPLFQVMLVLQNAPFEPLRLGDVALQPWEIEARTARFDWTLSLTETMGELRGSLEYRSDLFDTTTIQRFLGCFRLLLRQALTMPQSRLADLPMLSRGERQQLLHEGYATESQAVDSSRSAVTLVDLFIARVVRTPDAVAMVGGDPSNGIQWSYRALAARAEGLAHRLRRLGVGPETRVGLCVERGPEMVAALLGILEAGGAYVPLDPYYPAARLAFMLEDSGAAVLVTESAHRHLFAKTSAVEVIELDAPAENSSLDHGRLPSAVWPNQLAYVIYTSGSTGKPKGVQISHRSLVSFLDAIARRPGLGSHDVLTAVTSLSFDIAGLELFLPLVRGARLVLASREEAGDGKRLLARLEQTRTTVLQATPATWWMMIAAGWRRAAAGEAWRGAVWCGGEALAPELASELLARSPSVWNLYGPTEATIWSTVERITRPGAILIGRPLANTRTCVLDGALRGVPRGVIGELHLGGQGLGRGYLGRSALTVAVFVPDPHAQRPGERLYKTGDLARHRADGSLECLGRRDQQVKLRGFRIELGEIETRLGQAPGIRQAVVVLDAGDADDSGARLVAYVLARCRPMPGTEALLDFLRDKLPAHMLPSLIVELEAWPLTPNGKVDRLALRRRAASEARMHAVGDPVTGATMAPQSPTEEVLAAIWQDVLGGAAQGLGEATQRLGVHDNFFALGGHSLLAVQVLWRLPEALGVELPLRALFESPTVAGLAKQVEAARREGPAATGDTFAGVPLEAITRQPEGLPLSFAQQRLWILDRLGAEDGAYNMPAAVRLSGALDPAALRRSLVEILRRHEALRTVFRDVSGSPVQVMTEVDPRSFATVELERLEPADREREAHRLAQEEAWQPFDLARGPLCRVRWLDLGVDDQILLVTMHHIVSDGWSIGIFVRELSVLYEAFRCGKPSPLLPLPVQYADFAVWQRRWLTAQGRESGRGARVEPSSVLERQLAYWHERLTSAPQILELPTDRPRPPVQSFAGARQPFGLDDELTDGLRALCRSRGVTLFMALLAAFDVLLYRLTGSRDLLVGTPVVNRPRPELEGLIGFFVNTLVLRSEVAPAATFEDLLEQVRWTALAAYAHQEVPFEQLVQELEIPRNLSTSPLFQVMLVLQNAPFEPLRLGEVSLCPWEVEARTARFDWTLILMEKSRELQGNLEYRSDLFDATTIQRFVGHFRSLVRAAVATPGRRLSDLPLLNSGERQQLLHEWQDGAVESVAGEVAGEVARVAGWPSLPGLFADIVEGTPDAVALILDDQRLTYGELSQRAGRVAAALRSGGAGPETLVAIAMERSVEMIVAILGVLQAGAAYLPLDPESPAERLNWVLEDSGAALLLVREPTRATLTHLKVTVRAVESLATTPSEEPRFRQVVFEPASLAYAIYTSGSTGRPKGVGISHAAAANTLRWRLAAFELSQRDVVLQTIHYTFDPSIWQIFGALLAGGSLVLVRSGSERDYSYLVRRMAEERVTITDLAPSMLHVFLEQRGVESACRLLRLLFAGGEAMPVALKESFLATLDADLRNIYGPTEAAIDAACWSCCPDPEQTHVPIGRAVAGKRLRVLDPRGKPVPVGVPGELYIGGAGLGRGYLARPGLTAERFVPDAFSVTADRRFYRTGDLVRFLAGGTLEFLGRLDRQVKVRGYRIELGEVEAAMAAHPRVREAAVVAYSATSGADASAVDTRLAGYFVSEGEAVEARTVRKLLLERLPDFMVPQSLLAVPALPRNTSGKVDFSALPEPQRANTTPERPVLAPRTALERTLAAIWHEVLAARPSAEVASSDAISVDDNFFDVGGHSLLLVQVHSRLQDALRQEIPVTDLFNYPTIRSLARHLAPAIAEAQLPPDAVVRSTGRVGAAADGPEVLAILAMVGRFPGSASVEELWRNLCAGAEGLAAFSDDELLAAGVSRADLEAADFVKAGGVVDGAELFDADFFDLAPREAEVLDPQQRLFLEACWQALEAAGYDPGRHPGAVGVYAGVSANTYLINNLLTRPELLAAAGLDRVSLASHNDFLATRIAYKLGLTGPALTVQTACSTSLVAVHLAGQALLSGECNMALAGGCSISVPQRRGYFYREGGISSPDGHCRPFDAAARGTVKGNGYGVVVLKRLSRALADGDPIRAVIRATAINNDGAAKVGYTAPGIDGQAEVVASALARAGVEARQIGYLEAHGTATQLGDPVEIAALAKAFGDSVKGRQCAIGSIKSNIGHLDAAAGIAGLIKTALVLEHGRIPPSLHFETPNPQIDFAATPFRVNAALADWPRDGDSARRAAVSSFGIGGTNAHAVLEEAPAREASGPSTGPQLVVLSARTADALEDATDNLAAHLETLQESARPEDLPQDFADVAYTLRGGRRRFEQRRMAVCHDPADAAAVLRNRDASRLVSHVASGREPSVIFLFPGQGAQYAGMSEGLYRSKPQFSAIVDHAAGFLAPLLGEDLRRLLYPTQDSRHDADRRLAETAFTQPALFVVEYALARLWTAWGIQPAAALGHSIGEVVAACLAGVMTLEEALRLVAVRGRLMQKLPPGAMLAVGLGEDAVAEYLGQQLSLAATGGPSSSVVSGSGEAITALERLLRAAGVACRRLRTSHAFHSAMMDPILPDFAAEVAQVDLQPPKIPYLSNLSGTWIEATQATDPNYWVEHLRRPVRLAEGLATLLEEPDVVLLEAGPGRSLGSLARRLAAASDTSRPLFLSSMPSRSAAESVAAESASTPSVAGSERGVLLTALGQLWLAGAPIDEGAFYGEERRHRVALPTYPFQRRKFWIEAASGSGRVAAAKPAGRAADPANWFYVPAWREAPLASSGRTVGTDWLIFGHREGAVSELSEELARRLAEGGHRVAVAVPGKGFEATGEGRYTLDPGRREDYGLLLGATGSARSRRVVHLWAAGGAAAEVTTTAVLEQSFYSLLYLAQALALATDSDEAVEITVVSQGLHDVTGDEELVPLAATLLGPVRVIPLEIPQVACRSVDVVWPVGDWRRQRLIEQLMTELTRPVSASVVAWRGSRRFTQASEPLPSAAVGESPEPLRDDAVVLVTGGLGGIGLELARGIAERVRARLVLIGRSAEPGCASDAVQTLEALGAEVLVLAADVSDREQMQRAIGAARDRFGGIDAVIHAAGIAGGGLIALKDRATADAVLAPKVQGTLVLASLLKDTKLDYFVVCSSLASLLGGIGQVDYAAANAFLDAFAAAAASRGGPPIQAINWESWRETGMAFRAAHERAAHERAARERAAHERTAEEPGRGAAQLRNGLTSSEGVDVFQRVVADGRHQAIVSVTDFGALVQQTREHRISAPPSASRASFHGSEDGVAWTGSGNQVEERLAAIFQEVLGIECIGFDDDFVDLGGDSLMAIQVIARITQELDVRLPLQTLFEAPTVSRLAVAIRQQEDCRESSGGEAGEGVEVAAEEHLLSFQQQRLWFLDQLEPDNAFYNVSGAHRLLGAVAPVSLERALNEVVRRHEVLRTIFPSLDGEPRQQILSPRERALPVTDLSALTGDTRLAEARRLAVAESLRTFDLARGPLFRFQLLRLDAEDWVLLLTLHHICADGWSMRVLIRELQALYEVLVSGGEARQLSQVLPPLPWQYKDFAAAQRRRLHDDVLAEPMRYWQEQLAGAPKTLDLPADRPRPAVQTFRGGDVPFTVPPATLAGLRSLARRCGVTLFMIIFSTLDTLLYRTSGQRDLVVGVPMANRDELATEGLIGFFVNTLALRVELAGDLPWCDLLQRAKTVTLQAHAHQDVPFERLVEVLQPERNLSAAPLFQVLLAHQNIPGETRRLKDMPLEPWLLESRTVLFDLTLSLEESPESLRGTFEYARDLFDKTRIGRLADHFLNLLAGIVADPQSPLLAFDLLSSAQRHQVLGEWNDTAPEGEPKTVRELWTRRIADHPDRSAVVFEDQTLSYSQLAASAEGLARRLRQLGVGPESRVGIAMGRGPQVAVAVLGTLGAGGVCVPIDPAYPPQRLRFMIDDSAVAVLITDPVTAASLPATSVRTLCLEDVACAETVSDDEASSFDVDLDLDHLLYVIYTSGSTGRPKGVALSHRCFASLIPWYLENHLGGARTLQFASLSFDVSFYEMFVTWLSGGTLVQVSEALRRDPEALHRLLHALRIEKVILPVVLLHQLAELWSGRPPSHLREVTSTGEQLRMTETVRALFAPGRDLTLHNHYGPSESHVVTAQPLVSKEALSPSHPPIGRPIRGSRVLIANPGLRAAPSGVGGELLIGGESLARGYLDRPRKTAENFVPDPFSVLPGSRLYRTGDLARHLSDGTIEYLARIDHQVKIRGFRVEPVEVEARLAEDPRLEESIVVARPGDGAGAPARLVAYVVPGERRGSTEAALVQDLRAFLLEKLPEYMIPSAFVPLAALPLNPNGKVDRRALPEPDPDQRPFSQPWVAPRTPVEELIASIWSEALGRDRVGVDDDFFALGGHSLLATRVISRLRQRFGVEIMLRELFEAPTVVALAERVEAAMKTGQGLAMSAIEPRPRDPQTEVAIPLSFAQQRLWFLDQLTPGSPAYHLPAAVRLEGRLLPSTLARCLSEIVRRHEALRTTFVLPDEALHREEPVQRIQPPTPQALPIVDLSVLERTAARDERRRIIRAEARAPFDLAAGPLMRARLLRLGREDHVLLVTQHHIVSDGWSIGVLIRELMTLYGAFSRGEPSPLPELTIQYADFALWQHHWLVGEVLESQMAYWRQQLGSDAAPLELPLDRPRPPVRSARGARCQRPLDPVVEKRFQALARDQGVTPFMILLACLDVLLHRYTGQRTLAVGAPIANRNRAETEDLVGFFVNTLTLKVDVGGRPDFCQLLARVRQLTLEAYAHQDVPFEKIVEELQPQRDLSHSPFFQVFLQLQNTPQAELDLPGLRLRGMSQEQGAAKFDLTLAAEELEGGLHLGLEYSTDLFDATTLRRFLGHFETLLAAATAEPTLSIEALPLIARAERYQLRGEWNDTTTLYPRSFGPSDLPIAARFEAQVERTPEAIAMVFEGSVLEDSLLEDRAGEDQNLSYRALDRWADRLARRLRRHGVGPETVVGVCMERSAELMIALLGTFKAGGAYLPLDPEYPGERLAHMLVETGAPVLLAQRDFMADHVPAGVERIVLDRAPETLLDEDPRGELPEASATTAGLDSLAYVIYTSGSTGRPKGVMVAHRGVVNRLLWLQALDGLTPADRVMQKTPFTFDVSVWELFWPLISGATLVVARPDGHRDPAYLVREIERRRVSLMHFVPSMLWLFLEEPNLEAACRGLRRVIASGEAISVPLKERFFSRLDVDLINLYGPTEGSIEVTIWNCRGGAALRTVPIGRPIANLGIHLLDPALRPVPIGVPGELHIAGVGVTRGYLGQPGLTAKRFVPDPVAAVSGGRLYRTGDRSRHLADGSIEFQGRLDFQTKVRGFRIEPEEIEAVLSEHPAVGEVVVVARAVAQGTAGQDTAGQEDVQLVAYLVASSTPESTAVAVPAAAELRALLASRLPAYMVPSAFVPVEALPQTSSGKVDRAGLARRALPTAASQAVYEEPLSETERLVADAWRQLLQVERVGLADNFFDLGGHSLLMVRLLRRLEECFKRPIPLVAGFEHPTVRSQAAFLDRDAPSTPASQQRGQARGARRRQMARRRRR